MVRILGFHCCGPGSIPHQGTEILQAVHRGKKKKGTEKYDNGSWPVSWLEKYEVNIIYCIDCH